MYNKQKMQAEQLIALFNQKGFSFTEKWFPYTSGEIGNYYIQSIVITGNGETYSSAINAMVQLIENKIGVENFDIVSGGESRDWDFSNPIAVILEKPHLKMYKNGKALGVKDIKGKRVLHIADLNNEGSSPRDKWVPKIKELGGTITDIVFYVDRMEDGVQAMKNLGLKSHNVISLDQNAWDTLLEIQYITPEIHKSLMERLKDKKNWAHNALKKNPELLKELLYSDDPEKVAKGKKILEKGYPEISNELKLLM